MPVFDAAALNDNDENLAVLRTVLAPTAGGGRWSAPARSDRTRVPLIVGVAVAIMTGAEPQTRR